MKPIGELPEVKLIDCRDIVFTINQWTKQKSERPEEFSKVNNKYIEHIQEAIDRYKKPKVIT